MSVRMCVSLSLPTHLCEHKREHHHVTMRTGISIPLHAANKCQDYTAQLQTKMKALVQAAEEHRRACHDLAMVGNKDEKSKRWSPCLCLCVCVCVCVKLAIKAVPIC